MAIPAMALLQQHDARRHILIETAARRHAAIEAFRTGGIQNWGRSELGHNRAVKTNRLVIIIITAPQAFTIMSHTIFTTSKIKYAISVTKNA